MPSVGRGLVGSRPWCACGGGACLMRISGCDESACRQTGMRTYEVTIGSHRPYTSATTLVAAIVLARRTLRRSLIGLWLVRKSCTSTGTRVKLAHISSLWNGRVGKMGSSPCGSRGSCVGALGSGGRRIAAGGPVLVARFSWSCMLGESHHDDAAQRTNYMVHKYTRAMKMMSLGRFNEANHYTISLLYHDGKVRDGHLLCPCRASRSDGASEGQQKRVLAEADRRVEEGGRGKPVGEGRGGGAQRGTRGEIMVQGGKKVPIIREAQGRGTLRRPWRREQRGGKGSIGRENIEDEGWSRRRLHFSRVHCCRFRINFPITDLPWRLAEFVLPVWVFSCMVSCGGGHQQPRSPHLSHRHTLLRC